MFAMAIDPGNDEMLANLSLAPLSMKSAQVPVKEPPTIMTVVQVDDQKAKPVQKPQKPLLQPYDPLERPSPASDSDLGRIFALSPLPTLVLDAKLQVVQVSDSHLSLSGYTRAEIIGHSVYDLPSHKVPARDVTGLHRSITHAMKTGTVQIIEDVDINDEMGSRVFNVHITPIREEGDLRYLIIAAHDVTKESTAHQNNNELAYMNETYKILVETVKDYAIFMLDTSGHIATWNAGAAILKGYSSDEIIGRHFSTLYGDDDRAVDKPGKELELCLREGKVEDEGWRYRKDGSRFWANVMITPVYTAGRHIGFSKVTRDLTERKEAESRLIAAFEESSKLKSDFLANISHEIRTPMHGMLMAIQMLSETTLQEKQKEYIGIIKDTGSVLLQIINDVLDYSKLSSGTFTITPGVVNVKEIIGAVSRNCQSSLKPGVELHVHCPDDIPKHLRGDPLRYRQIIQNLIGNAVKFTESGSVHVFVTLAKHPTNGNTYEVTTKVVDTGIGIDENAASSLFVPFTRFADTSHKRYQGTGLGLSICKSLAELMDGTVGFHPNPDAQGSVFWLKTNMGTTDNIRPGPWAREPKDQDLNAKIQQLAPRKQLLLVEDNMVNQTIMLKMLNLIGFERVDTAWNGSEAVRKVKQKPLSYNAILMDINMPVMNGVDATVAIRRMSRDVPIIAMTGNALKGDAETYFASGMNDYIAKPVHKQHLVSVLLKWIGP